MVLSPELTLIVRTLISKWNEWRMVWRFERNFEVVCRLSSYTQVLSALTRELGLTQIAMRNSLFEAVRAALGIVEPRMADELQGLWEWYHMELHTSFTLKTLKEIEDYENNPVGVGEAIPFTEEHGRRKKQAKRNLKRQRLATILEADEWGNMEPIPLLRPLRIVRSPFQKLISRTHILTPHLIRVYDAQPGETLDLFFRRARNHTALELETFGYLVGGVIDGGLVVGGLFLPEQKCTSSRVSRIAEGCWEVSTYRVLHVLTNLTPHSSFGCSATLLM